MSKRKQRIYPEDEAQLYIRSATDKPGLMERFIDSYKGRGVFACQPIEPGTFVLEYRGELLSMKECQSRSYSEQESTFLFEFEWQNHQWCIDASKEDGSLGRLVNDNHKSPNCTMKKIVVNGKPHLCLFSVKKIEVGTEIDYNYGKSKWPWRKKVTTFQTSSGATSTGTPPTEQSEDDGPSQVDPRMQVTTFQTSSGATSTRTPPTEQSEDDGPSQVDPRMQVTTFQTSSGATSTGTPPTEQSEDDGPSQVDPRMQVTTFQTSSGATSTGTPPTEQSEDDGPSQVDPRMQVTTFQTSSGATSTGTPPTEQSEDDGPSQVDPRMQVVTFQGISLVDYLVSDDSEDLDLLTHSNFDETKRKNENISVHCVPVHPFSPSTPNDKIVDFGEEDEYVPKLKRTKSILMDRLPDFSDALFDSSDDEETLSKSKSEMVSQRPSRSQSCPLEHSLTSSDEMSGSSGDEYVPNPKEDYTDSDVSTETLLGSQKKRKCTQRKRKSSSQDLFNDSVSPSIDTSQDFTQRLDANKDESASLEENPSVFVYPVSKKEDGSRCYNKKHQCLYCDEVIQKMSRHLKRKHMDKVDVAKAFSLPKNSKERRAQLDYIRNRGNFKHNNEVLENHEGKLIPSKQPNKKTDGRIFTHCVYCFGLFKKKLMWRHFQACKLKPHSKPSKQGKSRVQALCAFAEPAPSGLSDPYWKFLSYMHQDKIAVSIKQDPCILEYGYRLFTKNEKTISQHQYIRQKLRELGRLLLEAKKDAPVKTIKDLIKPEKYNFIVGVVKRLSGFSEETGRFQRPSLARKVGHSLHSLAMFIKSEGLKNQDKTVVQKADEFAQLYQESWKFDVASQALTQLDQTKWQSPQVLPFTEDVQILHRYLLDKEKHHLKRLKEEPSASNWKDLAKVTLAQIILFNRRRAGEVSRMPLSFYLSKDTSETHEDVNMALTALEQKLCKHFVRITIVGKRGRHVPVLLTPLMKQSLDALIENREGCGVLNDNGYLFALPYSVHYLRGSDSIRQFVSECDGIKNPKALTSTKLRKHIATLSTVLNLKNTELDQLADFLGHNIQVHRKHYRLPEGTLQLAKISKVLLAMEQGRLGDYKGKSLDEINVDVNETVDADGYAQEDMEGNQISPSLSSFWTKNLMKLMDVPKKMWKMVMLLRCSQRLSQHPSKNTPNKVAKNRRHKKEMLLLLTLWSWKRSAQHPKKVTSPQRR